MLIMDYFSRLWVFHAVYGKFRLIIGFSHRLWLSKKDIAFTRHSRPMLARTFEFKV